MVKGEMKTIMVGIAECRVSNDPACELVTYSLGSCVAVTVYDPAVHVGGLLHFQLPESALDRAKARQNPFLFADTGVSTLLRQACRLGGDQRRFIVRVAGGAQLLEHGEHFGIGRKNCAAMKKALHKAGLCLHGEALGGTASRTVRLNLATGEFQLRAFRLSAPTTPRRKT